MEADHGSEMHTPIKLRALIGEWVKLQSERQILDCQKLARNSRAKALVCFG